MRWYKPLYVGPKAKKKRYALIQKIRSGEYHPTLYVITPSQNGNNILDIYPMLTWLPYYQKNPDVLIVGIADGYWEALEVVRQIVDDLYHRTGELYFRSLSK